MRHRRNDERRRRTRPPWLCLCNKLVLQFAQQRRGDRTKAKAGIWQGEIQRPQEWRDQEWRDAKRDAPDGCPIKGFVRASTKLYTLPWSADYDRAKVHTEKGERWFCSEGEAKAAGFTSSSRF